MEYEIHLGQTEVSTAEQSILESSEHIFYQITRITKFADKYHWCKQNCKDDFKFSFEIFPNFENFRTVFEIYIQFESEEDFVHYGLKWEE